MSTFPLDEASLAAFMKLLSVKINQTRTDRSAGANMVGNGRVSDLKKA
jgi:hypothetical protein